MRKQLITRKTVGCNGAYLMKQAVGRHMRGILAHAAMALLLGVSMAPVRATVIDDPSRFATYNKPGLPSHRLMRGLGGPDRIERMTDGTSVFWYHWTLTRPQGDIVARGLIAYSFTKDNRLNGFEILRMEDNGQYADSTLEEVMALAHP